MYSLKDACNCFPTTSTWTEYFESLGKELLFTVCFILFCFAYLFRFSAFNSDVPAAPSSVTVWRSIQTRLVTVQWNPPVSGQAEGSLLSFVIQYHAVSSPSIITMVTAFASNNSYELSNLVLYTNYSVKVAAVSIVGEGLWSTSVVFQTYSVGKWFSALSYVTLTSVADPQGLTNTNGKPPR